MNRVSFSKDSQMFVVANRRGNVGHRNKMWYSVDELLSLKADMSCLIAQTRMDISSRSFCWDKLVGLEKRLSAGLAREYKQRKRSLFLAIHAEQRLQKALDIPNPDRIATVSMRHSQWAVERARAAALLLELDIVFSSPPTGNAESGI
ncbi:hypothetical protein ACHAW5_002846 [Stephanodiscus triporus]|uniref:Uncharacterized protein n=1 Tax=Stephanodiscus triporus TaxID=2934178 RepID=A0ABD3Q280_9STRA